MINCLIEIIEDVFWRVVSEVSDRQNVEGG